MTRRLAVLGSTGSVGRQTLDVVREFPGEFEVAALSAHSSAEELAAQVDEFGPDTVALTESRVPEDGTDTRWLEGPEGLRAIARMSLDILVLAVVGSAGLRPCLEALERDTNVALANKEVLVMAGELVKRAERRSEGRIIPVDSEHSALFQALRGERLREVKRVIITASGGPFRTLSREEMESVTLDETLDHPNWDMGPKITVDSATMMNKGLELIEACYLLDLEPDQVEALVHPQSMIHGFVEFQDHSLIAQCAAPDMRLPIQYALFYPERRRPVIDPVPLEEAFAWEFEPVDEERFPAFALAREALRLGGSAPAVLNAANEEAVRAFLDRRIAYHRIPRVVERCLREHNLEDELELDQLLEVDRWARQWVKRTLRRETD